MLFALASIFCAEKLAVVATTKIPTDIFLKSVCIICDLRFGLKF